MRMYHAQRKRNQEGRVISNLRVAISDNQLMFTNTTDLLSIESISDNELVLLWQYADMELRHRKHIRAALA